MNFFLRENVFRTFDFVEKYNYQKNEKIKRLPQKQFLSGFNSF